MTLRRLSGAVCLAIAAASFSAAQAQPKSDWEIKLDESEWKEGDIKLPDYPSPQNLIEFESLAAGNFRFFVDGQSLSAGADGAVRYTLVARSGSGVENASFNGLRCKAGTHKVYATGRSDKTWAPVPAGDWKTIQLNSAARQHVILMRDFFCPSGVPIMSREEGLDALRKGFHPYAPGNHPGMGRR